MSINLLDKIIESINPETKSGLRVLTAVLIVCLVAIFLICFILPIEFVRNSIDILKIPRTFLVLLFSASIYLIIILIFSADTLYYGDPQKNIYAKTFQAFWPSRYLAKTLDISFENASNLWFNEFNKWKGSNNPNHELWLKTLQRGYFCRLVYYLLYYSSLIIFFSLLLLILELISRKYNFIWINSSTFLPRILFIICVSCFWLIVRLTNRLKWKGPSGVWRRYNEINRMNIEWVKSNIDYFRGSIKA